MPLFRVSLPVQLDIEVDATDALTARRLIDDAFKRVDPLNSPNVRVQVKSSLSQVARAASSMPLRKGLRSSPMLAWSPSRAPSPYRSPERGTGRKIAATPIRPAAALHI